MATVDTTNTANSVLSNFAIGNKTAEEPKNNELGQTAFLELMITQMENQNPLDPQDNTEFIAQLAQFSSVEGLQRLNENFDDFSASFLSNQALQASSLVGTSVSVLADTTDLAAGGLVSGTVDIPASSQDVKLNIYSEAGTLLEQISLGTQPSGEMVFRWDGANVEVNGELLDWQSDEPLGAGTYEFEVTVLEDGERVALDTALSANVNSVTLGANGGVTLNLAGLGAVDIADVKQFN